MPDKNSVIIDSLHCIELLSQYIIFINKMQKTLPMVSIVPMKEKNIPSTSILNEDLSERLIEVICVVCNNIPLTPTSCKTCHNIFCRECVTSWLQQGKGCPLRCNYEEVDISGEKRLLLSQLKLKCFNAEKGCQLVVPYSDYVKHLLFECDINTYKCIGCTTTGPKRMLLMHSNVCEKLEDPCPFCKASYKREQMGAHIKGCDLKIIECPSCSKDVLQKDIKAHSDECNVVFECHYCKIKFDKNNSEKDHTKDECFNSLIAGFNNRIHHLTIELEHANKKINELEYENKNLKASSSSSNGKHDANMNFKDWFQNLNNAGGNGGIPNMPNYGFGQGSHAASNSNAGSGNPDPAGGADVGANAGGANAEEDPKNVQCKNQ
jgi:hypothetical protein